MFANLYSTFYRGFICLVLSLIASVSLAASDPLRQKLFANIDEVLAQAKAENAAILAPVSFKKGMDAYSDANNLYKKNKSVDKIKKEIDKADAEFTKSIETTKLANITFKSALKARNDAKGVEAERLSAEQWKKAEKQFKSAAQALEVGSLANARKKSDTAEATYRAAELTAIKGSYLNQTREVIARAKKERVDRYAPLTLAKAQSLLAKAEKELSENRYDTDYPRSLVKDSLYQAKHSIFLANYVKKIRSDDITNEQLLLRLEEPVTSIASALDLVAEFDKGFQVPTNKIKARVTDLLTESHDLVELKGQMKKLEKDYSGLEDRLGIQSERMARQEEQRRKIADLNRLFTAEEAVVLTQGDSIIIRAVGLSFDPGSSKVNTSNEQLLRKLQKVFRVLNGYDVVVEGHTDSFGGDSQNLILSFDRANAVREYFVVNMPGFSEAASQSTGLGETRPIANNETREGRSRNRRIDLVFSPRS